MSFKSTVEKILDRLDIVEIVGARVKLKRSGKNFTGCCPFHQEKTPSFSVNKDKGFYHCFGCKASGDAIRFIMETENRTFMDVLEDLSKRTGVELPKDDRNHNKLTYTKKLPTKAPPANPPTPVAIPKTPELNKTILNTLIQHNIAPPLNKAKPIPSNGVFSFAVIDDDIDPVTIRADNSDTVQPINTNPIEYLPIEPADMLEPIWSEDMLFMDAPAEDTANTGDYLADWDMIDPSQPSPAKNTPTEGNLYELLESIAQFYQTALTHNPKAQQYLKGRGLTQATIDFWRIGYAPDDFNHLLQHFAADIDGLRLLGLIRSNDYGKDYCLLRDRVIFPIRNLRGRIVGFGGRALNNDIKPKYINSPESEVFKKSDILFGLYEGQKARSEHWMMVEGFLDVISLYQSGLTGAVASMGTATNAEHLQLLFKQTQSITLAFDGDSAGQKAAWRTLEIALPLLNDGRELRFLVLPADQDPDSLMRLEGMNAFKRRIDNSPALSDFLYASLEKHYDLTKPEAKASLLAEVKRYTDLLPQYGNYKWLLTKTIREKIGFGWYKKSAQSSDHILNFKSYSCENRIILLLLYYPYLADILERVKPLLASSSKLVKLLSLIEQYQTILLDNLQADIVEHEVSACFLLGAWQDMASLKEICMLFESLDVSTLPPKLDEQCQLLTSELEIQLLQHRQQTASSLNEKRLLKAQISAKREKLAKPST